jgi:hypothetical protein
MKPITLTATELHHLIFYYVVRAKQLYKNVSGINRVGDDISLEINGCNAMSHVCDTDKLYDIYERLVNYVGPIPTNPIFFKGQWHGQ